MKRIKLDWKRLKQLFQGLKFNDYLFLIFTVTGINAAALIQYLVPQNELPRYVPPLLIGASLAFLVFILAFVSGKEKAPYMFEEQSQDEADFFERWYRQSGQLTMFCTDLDWLEDDKYAKVKDALQDKSDKHKLKLFLKEYDNKFVDALVAVYGAELHKVRKDIRSSHRFSVLEDGGYLSIIIRNKDVEPDQTKKIRIEEYNNNSALVNVALDMLDDCEIKSTRKFNRYPIKRRK